MDDFLPILHRFCEKIDKDPQLLHGAELKFFRECMLLHLNDSAIRSASDDEDESPPPPPSAPSTTSEPIVLDLSNQHQGSAPMPNATPRIEDLIANPAVMNMAKNMMSNPELMQQMLSGLSGTPPPRQ